ncbi:hypothetical protein [Brucella lupini]
MKLTARPKNKKGETRTLSEQSLVTNITDDWIEQRILPGTDGSIRIKFTAEGIDNKNASYEYNIRLTKEEVAEISAAHALQPLYEKIDTQASKIAELESALEKRIRSEKS